jgi:Spy/CpxP family protein refolding chaperone
MNHRIAAIPLVLIASLIASLIGSTVFAESGERSGGDFGAPGHFSEKMADRLGLDETQRQTVQNIRLAAEPEVTALRERMQANREKMKALDANDPNRSALLNDIAVEKGQLATESTLLFDRVRNEFSAVLTDEQRAKVEEHRGGKGKRGRRS